MSEHRIKVSHVVYALELRRDINKLPFDEIVWVDDDDNEIDIEDNAKTEFKFCGLNNCDFISTGYYLKKDVQVFFKTTKDTKDD